jgi:CxxC motif-containing protein
MATEVKNKVITCILCPLGCRIKVSRNRGTILVKGNKCAKGKDYAIKELTHPVRVLTATIRVRNGILPLLPVRTTQPIPKKQVFTCLKKLYQVEVKAPIKMGTIIVKNIADTDSDVISTRGIDSKH